MPSLTQDEAAERGRQLRVERYDVAVDLTDLPTGPEVRCVSTISFSCLEAAESFVDCAAQVREASLDGTPLAAAVDGRIALPGLSVGPHTLVVSSVAVDTSGGEGAHKAVDPADGEVYLWMSFEPDECRNVWACFDQPDLKAPHALTVTAPAAWRVCTNSGDPVITDTDIDTDAGTLAARTWAFPDTPALATYNIVVDAGPFHELRREAGGHDLGILARRSLAGVLDRDADMLFEVTEQGLDFFGRVFAMPFPQRKYDQVFVPEMGGAMENYGCVTWSDAFLSRSSPTPAERELLALVLLHEMAHMWFGNIVTMRWWDDLWLNEAFAEFAAHWAGTEATSYTDVWAAHLAGEELMAYSADQGPTSHPIHQPIADVEQAMSIFDNITYPKGAQVLRQLKEYVGDEAFRQGMSAYFAQHAWGSTTLQDLIDALATASGKDLDVWRAGWLSVAGTDRLTLEQDASGLVLVGSGPMGPPRPQVVAVGAYRRTGTSLERTGLARVEVDGARTPVDLPAGADLYLVNDDDLTFATTRPDASTRDALFADAALLPSAISRGVAVATAWDMLHNGEATAAEVVGCVCAVVLAETSPTVVEPYLRLAWTAAELWSTDADRVGLQEQVAACCRALAGDPERRQVAQRFLAQSSADPAELTALVAEAAGLETPDVDLQWRLLARLSELGGETGSEVERLLVADPDPDKWVRALTVRAAQPRAEAKREAWERLTVARDVPVSSMRMVGEAFWRRGQESLLAPYPDDFLALLPTLDRGGMIAALVNANVLFPTTAIDQDYLHRLLAATAGAAPVVGKTVGEQADVVGRMLTARG